MFKKITCAVVICMMAVTLFACKPNPTPAPTSSNKPITLPVVSGDLDEVVKSYKKDAERVCDFKSYYRVLELEIDVKKEFTGGKVDEITDKGLLKIGASGGPRPIYSLKMEHAEDGKKTQTDMVNDVDDNFKITVNGSEKKVEMPEFGVQLDQVGAVHMPQFDKAAVANLEKAEQGKNLVYTFTLMGGKMKEAVKAIETDVDLSKAEITVNNMVVTYSVNQIGNPLMMKLEYDATIEGAEVETIKTVATYNFKSTSAE